MRGLDVSGSGPQQLTASPAWEHGIPRSAQSTAIVAPSSQLRAMEPKQAESASFAHGATLPVKHARTLAQSMAARMQPVRDSNATGITSWNVPKPKARK